MLLKIKLYQTKNQLKNYTKQLLENVKKKSVRNTDLADMQLVSKFNKEFQFLLYVIDIYSEYVSYISLKD